MKRTGALTRSLAIAGTVLVSIPIIAPLLFSIIRFAQSGRFMLDWLMPAEFSWTVVGNSCGSRDPRARLEGQGQGSLAKPRHAGPRSSCGSDAHGIMSRGK